MSEQTPSKQPASNGFVDAAAAWAALVRWREDLAAPLQARIAELERERDTAYEVVAETRQFLAKVARAYQQWMDACAPREWCSLQADDKEHNGLVQHMHDMMSLLVKFAEDCPPYDRAALEEKEADRG